MKTIGRKEYAMALAALALAILTSLLGGCAIEEDPNDPNLPAFDGADEIIDVETPSDEPARDDLIVAPAGDESEEEGCEEEEPACELPSEDATLGHRPTVSYAAPPNSTLADGKITHGRIIITADADQDIAIRQLTFNVRHSDVAINLDSMVREAGTGTYFDSTTSTHCHGTPNPCSEYDVTITLREDIWIAAGTSKAFDIDTTVSSVSSGDWVETSFKSDGTLVSSCELEDDGHNYSITGTTPNFIWTDESGVHHSGAGITPFGPMTLSAL